MSKYYNSLPFLALQIGGVLTLEIMMTININIKADVDNLTLAEIYELLSIYSLDKDRDKKEFLDFKGYKFKIKADTDFSINYFITEI